MKARLQIRLIPFLRASFCPVNPGKPSGNLLPGPPYWGKLAWSGMTSEEDRPFWELPLDPKAHKKAYLWAMMVFLAAESWTTSRIAQYFHKDRTTVYLVLKPFLEHGLQDLSYRKPPGALRKLTPGVAIFVRERLTAAFPPGKHLEDRVSTALQLAEALAGRFDICLRFPGTSNVGKQRGYAPTGRHGRGGGPGQST